MEQATETAKSKAKAKLERLGAEEVDFTGKTVVVVDDGMATGATMKTAVESAYNEGAEKVVVAVPVAPVSTVEAVQSSVDDLVVLETPRNFQAVGQFYKDFTQVTEEEAWKMLEAFSRTR